VVNLGFRILFGLPMDSEALENPLLLYTYIMKRNAQSDQTRESFSRTLMLLWELNKILNADDWMEICTLLAPDRVDSMQFRRIIAHRKLVMKLVEASKMPVYMGVDFWDVVNHWGHAGGDTVRGIAPSSHIIVDETNIAAHVSHHSSDSTRSHSHGCLSGSDTTTVCGESNVHGGRKERTSHDDGEDGVAKDGEDGNRVSVSTKNGESHSFPHSAQEPDVTR
jgi:hypothetical protein